jgi:hypothetical protein
VAAYVKSQEYKECILPVQTAMCDNFKDWGSFAENVLGIKSNVCLPHATGNNYFVLLHATSNVRLCCVSGIAAAKSSHVKQFPDVAAYDDYYYIVVDTCEIGFDQFATTQYRACWWIISELATVMKPPTGVIDSGWVIVVDIVSFIASMPLQQQYGRGSDMA